MFRLNDDKSTLGDRPRQGIRRRDEYAQATRQAIVDAARRLFSERGYFSTKVDDIAALARVAPATVYAVSGGKNGLLNALLGILGSTPIVAATLSRIEAMDDPAAIIRLVAKGCRRKREEFGDIMRVLLTTAPHDEAVSHILQAATADCRQGFVPVVQRLSDLGALSEGMDAKQAVDVFWFYFGYAGFSTLHDENGWSYDRAEQWLAEEASRALLQSHQTGSGGARFQTTNQQGHFDD